MFKAGKKRILYRIILPFAFLIGITTVISWLSSAYFLTHFLDRSLQAQMERVAGIISKSTYVANPAVLQQVKRVIHMEIVSFRSGGQVLSSTFRDPQIGEVLGPVLRDTSRRPMVAVDTMLRDVRYRVVSNPVPAAEGDRTFISLWMPMEEETRLKWRIILAMAGIGLIGTLAMIGIGYVIARSITRPLEGLARVSAEVSSGDFTKRAKVADKDEIGSLAEAFNRMLDQLKLFEQRLVQSEKLATAGQMAAGIAHEIRNPLTSIKMLGQVLQGRAKSDPETQKMLGSLVKEIDRLDRIIQEMINRTRADELHKDLSDINEQIEDVIVVAEQSLAAKGIQIRKGLSPEIPKIPVDRERMKQVFWNLLLNAAEAMPKGGTIFVSTRKGEAADVEVLIEDTGGGIRPDKQERLFEPFFTTKPDGIGLGLTISRKIVQEHEGDLIVEGRAGGGARARIRLPAA